MSKHINQLLRCIKSIGSNSMFLSFCVFLSNSEPINAQAATNKAIKILLITSGCCHNYPFQTKAMIDAMNKIAPKATWTVMSEGGTTTRGTIALYDNPDWGKNYDVIVHNECFADTKDSEYFRKITKAHYAGIPAVVIHCAMHTYRAAEENDWREFLGVTSKRHDEKQAKYPVTLVEAKHTILKGMPNNWVTPSDELYIIDKFWPNSKALASAVSEVDGKSYPIAWTNQYGKARVFGTTFGHSTGTFSDSIFLTMVSRGILWAAGAIK